MRRVKAKRTKLAWAWAATIVQRNFLGRRFADALCDCRDEFLDGGSLDK